MQLDKDFLKQMDSQPLSPTLIDTLTTSMARVKQGMEGLVKGLGGRVESIERDLVEPLEVF